MTLPVNVHWLGIRKDSGKGAFWGFFSFVPYEDLAYPREPKFWWTEEEKSRCQPDGLYHTFCYTISGRIGKNINIEKISYGEIFEEERCRGRNVGRSMLWGCEFLDCGVLCWRVGWGV